MNLLRLSRWGPNSRATLRQTGPRARVEFTTQTLRPPGRRCRKRAPSLLTSLHPDHSNSLAVQIATGAPSTTNTHLSSNRTRGYRKRRGIICAAYERRRTVRGAELQRLPDPVRRSAHDVHLRFFPILPRKTAAFQASKKAVPSVTAHWPQFLILHQIVVGFVSAVHTRRYNSPARHSWKVLVSPPLVKRRRPPS